MRSFALATSLAILAGTTAHAGGVNDPIVEPAVIVADAAASSQPSAGLTLGLMTLIVFGTALAQ